jgi:cell division protein YceG involved in septum cleavage
LLNADPTVIYGADTVALSDLPTDEWDMYRFWTVPETAMSDVALPAELQGFQTYQVPGLVPWPIATPTLGSIDAALAPDTKDKYIYFVAIPDSDGKHAFAKTNAEHQENLEKYGYR